MNNPHAISISLPKLSQVNIQLDKETDPLVEEEKDTIVAAPIIVTHEDETESPFRLLNSLATKRPSSASSRTNYT